MAASQSFREDIIKAVARIDGFEQQLANAVKAPERRIECISGAARASKPDLLTTVPPASSMITGNSPWIDLMRAAANGNIEAAKQRLSDKDKKNSDGDTALMVAARAGRVEVVELLDPTDEDGVTALMRAAEKGAVEDLALLIQCGANKQENYGYTALMYAAENGRTECVKLLAEQESGTQTTNGRAALIYAVANDSGVRKAPCREGGGMETACVRRGFSPGTPVLDIARRRGYSEVVDLLSGRF
ncbi:Ankyrin repeat protein [Giardia duodenalis]|uniref:Ankyrin repeat protein n=1 Tax=Giardia intestinalis TaxID=5741 RepID=V6TTR2_GIAIN|nr:Ankyrin repeat protein [Giardia intestinalis]